MAPCTTCHAGCCRAFAVPVTGADILRIEKESGLSFWDFACRWADREGRIAQNSAPHFYFSDDPTTPFVICLKHESSRFLSGTTKCQFLDESSPDAEHPLGLARCGIYDYRPMTCRAFPTKFDGSGHLVILCELPGQGRESDSHAYQLCPRPWEPDDVDPIQAVQDLAVSKHEMLFFRELAAAWNRQPRPWSVFPEFLHLVYSSRVVSEAGLTGREAAATSSQPPAQQTAEFRRAA